MEINMENNSKKSTLNNPDVNILLISEAILNDKQLHQLYAKRVEIYSLSTPTFILGKDGKPKTIWIDENNHHLHSKINEMIQQRTEQISQKNEAPRDENNLIYSHTS